MNPSHVKMCNPLEGYAARLSLMQQTTTEYRRIEIDELRIMKSSFLQYPRSLNTERKSQSAIDEVILGGWCGQILPYALVGKYLTMTILLKLMTMHLYSF